MVGLGSMPICKMSSAALSVLVISAMAAHAATVSKQNGSVFINAGAGFVELKSAADVSAGQQVLVQPGGIASIAYAGNCTVRVGSGVWLVQPTAPCKAPNRNNASKGRIISFVNLF